MSKITRKMIKKELIHSLSGIMEYIEEDLIYNINIFAEELSEETYTREQINSILQDQEGPWDEDRDLWKKICSYTAIKINEFEDDEKEEIL